MKIKKYIGQTTHEAMLKLKMELGPDAVILNTKTIRQKGFWGYFRKPLIEITAAYEDKDLLKVRTNGTDSYEKKLNNINEEIAELKEFLMNKPIIAKETEKISPVLEKISEIMIKNGVAPEVSKGIFNGISNDINLQEKDIDTVYRIIKFNLAEILGTPRPITIRDQQKIIFFVGPTGVGKTTTLAKIAANFVVKNQYDIGLITSDTYRIAAVEQLKIYSDILQLPLKIAYNKDDVIKSILDFQDKDVVLVDTAGRNHNDLSQIEELKEILNAIESKEVFLLVNASTDYNKIKTLIEKYEFLDDYRLIITKIDEAEEYGNILNIRYLTNKELSYFTTGQNVPDDIQLINTEDIIKKLMEE